MRRHGADMLRKVGTYEEIRGEKRKMKRRRHRKKNWDRHFYIQACSYIQICLTHTTVLLHKDCITHTHTLLHTYVIRTNTFTHRVAFTHKTILDTQFFWHTRTDSFTHKPSYTIYTDTPLRTIPFCTQTLLHANAFAHKRFLHTDTVTRKHVGRRTLQWAGSSHDSHLTLTRPMLWVCECVRMWRCHVKMYSRPPL